jgi:hypothetical protein
MLPPPSQLADQTARVPGSAKANTAMRLAFKRGVARQAPSMFAFAVSRQGLLIFLLLIGFLPVGCKQPAPTVAVIPRTCGTALWEPEHAGAAAAARSAGLNLYWNAPMRDDDIRSQIVPQMFGSPPTISTV